MKIAVDFDNTCTVYNYHGIERDIGAVPVLKRLAEAGHLLILNTMRSGEGLREAVSWFERNGIPLYGVNEDPDQKKWTQSPKVFADVYIDNAALGCPLRFDPSVSGSAFVDWKEVDQRMICLERIVGGLFKRLKNES